MMRKVLRRMREGGADINAVVRDLRIGRGTLNAILEMAIREGYLEKASTTLSCGGCFLRGKCKIEPNESEKTEMYYLTPKGQKYAGFKTTRWG